MKHTRQKIRKELGMGKRAGKKLQVGFLNKICLSKASKRQLREAGKGTHREGWRNDRGMVDIKKGLREEFKHCLGGVLVAVGRKRRACFCLLHIVLVLHLSPSGVSQFPDCGTTVPPGGAWTCILQRSRSTRRTKQKESKWLGLPIPNFSKQGKDRAQRGGSEKWHIGQNTAAHKVAQQWDEVQLFKDSGLEL